jgi:hypothetical protein
MSSPRRGQLHGTESFNPRPANTGVAAVRTSTAGVAAMFSRERTVVSCGSRGCASQRQPWTQRGVTARVAGNVKGPGSETESTGSTGSGGAHFENTERTEQGNGFIALIHCFVRQKTKARKTCRAFLLWDRFLCGNRESQFPEDAVFTSGTFFPLSSSFRTSTAFSSCASRPARKSCGVLSTSTSGGTP